MNQLLITLLSFYKTYIQDEQMLGLVLEETARKLVKPVVATIVVGQITYEYLWKLYQSSICWKPLKKLATITNF